MASDDVPESLVDLETVLEEVAAILATTSWPRAQLEDVKAELLRPSSTASIQRRSSALSQQRDADDDPLDFAIMAEHERVADEPD